MNIQVDPTRSNLASAMLNSKIRPRVVVGYGVKIFHFIPVLRITSPDHLEGIHSSDNIQCSLFCLQRIHQHHRWILMHPFHCHLPHKLYVIMQKKFCLGETVMLTKKRQRCFQTSCVRFQPSKPGSHNMTICVPSPYQGNAIKWSGTKVSFLTSTP